MDSSRYLYLNPSFIVVGICGFFFCIICNLNVQWPILKSTYSYPRSLEIIKYFPWCIMPRLVIQFKSDGQVLREMCVMICFFFCQPFSYSIYLFFSPICKHFLSIYFCVQLSYTKIRKQSWLQWSFGPNK